jgi:predicted nucleic acid-binding protein
MTVYALDTNIISYFLQKDRDIIEKISAIRQQKNEIVIPAIVYYEIRRGLLSFNAGSKMAVFEQFCKTFDVENITKETLDTAAVLYAHLKKQGHLIEDADLLVAAFCIRNECILVTNNTRHFNHIEALKLENWKINSPGAGLTNGAAKG